LQHFMVDQGHHVFLVRLPRLYGAANVVSGT